MAKGKDFIIVITAIVIITALVLIFIFVIRGMSIGKDKKFIESNQENAEKAASLVKSPSWDIARNTLDKYFTQNLVQLKYIFILSVSVMTLGFILISLGIYLNFINGTNYLITIASGVITEFIGATFLFIYRSSAKQANEYSKTLLERINSVGMAMQVIDSMTDDTNQKNRVKARLVELLVQQTYYIKEHGNLLELDNSKKA